MGKYSGGEGRLREIVHPFLARTIVVPADYKFHNTQAENMKFNTALIWGKGVINSLAGESAEPLAIDAFAGVGILTLAYLDMGFRTIAMERNASLAHALLENVRKEKATVHAGDNLEVLSQIRSCHPDIKLIDLDPYGSCVWQIREAARILKKGFLFVTCGDVYTGSRFKKWGFIKKRYGIDFSGTFQDYPMKVIYPFIQLEFQKLGKTAKLCGFFSFPTICRVCAEIY